MPERVTVLALALLLTLHIGRAEVSREVAAFLAAEEAGQNTERMKAALEDPDLLEAAVQWLSNYHDPGFQTRTRLLAASGNPEVRMWAVVSLTAQWDDSPEAKRVVGRALNDRNDRVRSAAALYFLVMGEAEDLPLLEQVDAWGDRYSKAAVQAALQAVRYRSGQTEAAHRVQTGDLTQAAREIAEHQSVANRVWGRRLLRETGEFEPHKKFYERQTPQEAEAGRERAALALAVTGLPLEGLDGVAGRPPGAWFTLEETAEAQEASASIVGDLIPPMRDHEETSNRYFGKTVEAGRGQRVHLGDDHGWYEPAQPVVAIGAGVVRYAAVASPGFGGLVVIEHRRRDGSAYCSLYGHLGLHLLVRKGMVVQPGQPVGSLGRSFTWENGGYIVHHHFAIHEGEWAGGEWIAGYMDPSTFERGDHGWRDPLKFLRNE